MQNLQLERPLVVFDIESTGVMPQRDRIVEIAVLKIFPDGHTQNTVRRLNPEMPIPPGATAIHGISDADVADCPTFLLIAEKLFRYIEDCDLAGYNITGFDIPMLEAEFKRAGFTFKVDDRKVEISAPSEAGVFYGIQTLRKSVSVHEGAGAVELPAVEINDSPRFSYRGMMLDVVNTCTEFTYSVTECTP